MGCTELTDLFSTFRLGIGRERNDLLRTFSITTRVHYKGLPKWKFPPCDADCRARCQCWSCPGPLPQWVRCAYERRQYSTSMMLVRTEDRNTTDYVVKAFLFWWQSFTVYHKLSGAGFLHPALLLLGTNHGWQEVLCLNPFTVLVGSP